MDRLPGRPRLAAPPRAPARALVRRGTVRRGTVRQLAAAAVVAAQIPYPLLPAGGGGRAWLTIGQVLAFFVASASHAAHRRGRVFAAGYLAITVGLGFAAEVVGLRTGWPFGHYSYTGRLGLEVAGVPAIIPLGWAMMAYPALLAGRWSAANAGLGPAGPRARVATALAGGVLLAGWDLFLDPRMVAEGFWVWEPGGGPALNGIPLTNAAGWLLVGATLVALLDRLPDPARRPAPDRPAAPRQRPGPVRWPAGDGVPLFLLCWTYGSWVLACLAFFGQPSVALAGAVGMALPALPRALARRPRPATPPRPTTPSRARVLARAPAAASSQPRPDQPDEPG
ncbi:carotenoid biosynthesis protein [Frankia nepalensis]|uniref:Carotenoid biosynthesis protein n=1 Tax=Frankia nepalensis TaxID=1836974 RepID=A0A937USB4_9ACTN|nr:carotenoid biosynthesis protein [Frankia nepalensis]MBL7501600.1 carotenoid biosynthesis protein [Frankia nepalensis]MBL7513393.1 carotenoid biosynthesis protein [Frankia nepalensis]MBL7633689.1 carotenoid biosynthesis protein [Frankia nepalensis]